MRDLLEQTLQSARPHDFRVCEAPSEAEGVIEAWLEFETAVGRGVGHLRLRDGRAWTLLTTLRELKGHEEPRGRSRPVGAEHGIDADRRSWLERRQREAAELGYETQPEVLATGMSGKPHRPSFPGQEGFAGEQQHSCEHPGPDAYPDKPVVVIGSNNSAFDICGALYEVGAEVTMVQRSSTHIVRSQLVFDVAFKGLYSEEAVTAMRASGLPLQEGLRAQARAHDLAVRVSGPPQMPLMLLFADDPEFARSLAWSGACAAHGVYLHPVHNWFLNAARDEATIDEVLERTDAAFDEIRDRFGAG